jgi:hypothetical protein
VTPFIIRCGLVALSICMVAVVGAAPAERVLLSVPSPDVKRLPALGVWQRAEQILVSAAFPEVPGFTCDSWCYEGTMVFVDAKPAQRGAIVLRHRLADDPEVLVVTRVTPQRGAVELVAHMEIDPIRRASGKLPGNPPFVNMCWQLARAEGFRSAPDPYLDFVKRCFIITQAGRTFLDHTVRRPIPVRNATDPYNNPPWVQMYVGAWQDVPPTTPTAWADYSPDRYTCRVIGAVSRGGVWLAALACDSSSVMAQAWHDCMHNNANWTPASAPMERRTWRVKIYAMRNDPDALLRRIRKDFPRVSEP